MSAIEAIQARLDAASEGPWAAATGATSDGSQVCTTYEQKKAFLALSLNDDADRPLWLVINDKVIPAATGDGPNAEANANFIANAPTDVAKLLAAVRAGRRVMAELEATYPSGKLWADKYRAALTAALEPSGE